MRTFSILSAAALTAAALVPALGTAASATSCVPIGENMPHALVTGTESRDDGTPTYLAADGVYAVVGTVTAVDTDASNQHGLTEVSVDVDAVFGMPSSAEQTRTEQPESEAPAAVMSGDGNGFPLGPVVVGLVGVVVAGTLLARWLRTARYRHAHGVGPA
jgi:hypothetical protein